MIRQKECKRKKHSFLSPWLPVGPTSRYFERHRRLCVHAHRIFGVDTWRYGWLPDIHNICAIDCVYSSSVCLLSCTVFFVDVRALSCVDFTIFVYVLFLIYGFLVLFIWLHLCCRLVRWFCSAIWGWMYYQNVIVMIGCVLYVNHVLIFVLYEYLCVVLI